MKTIRAIIAAAAIAVASAAAAAPPGIEIAGYRGSDAVLLSGPGVTVTERDAYLFVLLTNGDPAMVRDWRILDEAKRKSLKFLLEARLRTSIAARIAKSDPDTPDADPDFKRRAVRIYSGAAARTIWADTEVRRNVRIFPEDVLYQYVHHNSEFMAPATVSLRRLRVPLPTPASLSEINAARDRAEALRAEAMTGGGLAPLLEREPELLVDAVGRLATIQKDSVGVDPQIIDAAFRLGLSQVSEPIRTPAGFVLFEVVEKNLTDELPLEQVRPKIEDKLSTKFLPQQYDYMLAKALTDAYVTNRFHLYPFMSPDADIIRVRNFSLTQGEFTRLFPEVIGNPSKPNKAAIGTTASDICSAETVAQLLEKDGALHSDPLYGEAQAMAEEFFLATDWVRAKRAKIKPTPEETREYIAKNREAVSPGPSRLVWKFSIQPREVSILTQAELDSLRILMESYLGNRIEIARQQFSERAQVAAERGFAEPDKVMSNLPEPADRRLKMEFKQLGTYTRKSAAGDLDVPFDLLKPGDFTPPRLERNGAVVSFFTSEEFPEAAVDDEDLIEAAEQALIVEMSDKPVVAELELLRADGKLKFAPELN